MTAVELAAVVMAGLNLLLALAWVTFAQKGWRVRRARPAGALFLLGPLIAVAMVTNYSLQALFTLLPREVHQACPPGLVALYLLSDNSIIAAVALFRHATRYFPPVQQPPGPGWLAVNYGSLALMAGFELGFWLLVPGSEQHLLAYRIVLTSYCVGMFGLAVRQMARMAPRGGWRPGALDAVRRPDIVVLVAALLGAGGIFFLHLHGSWELHPLVLTALNLAVGFAIAAPIAVRILGEVVRNVLLVSALSAAAGAVYAGVPALLLPWVDPARRPLVALATVAALVLVLVPGQAWVRAAIEHVVFRRGRHRREALQAFLHTLTPELGGRECCRRALAEIVRVLELRGAAILLRDGEEVVEGRIAIEPLRRAWPRGTLADALPARAFVEDEHLPLALKEALLEAEVVAVVPIASRRRRWGDLFINTGLLGAVFSDDDLRAMEVFTDHVALLLDGADLLARAVAVERSLAHAEKLAALGELAARIAHEIRNPVTAARSLAQQLGREAGSLAEPAGLILTELARVERQVAALLRFARREEFHFEPVDLGDLARATTETFRPRLESAGIQLVLDVAPGVVARADRERLRQVLINLIENAIDALGDGVAPRRLVVSLASVNGTAALRVTDSGPGVPADALPRLFEPFFSLKEQGTGLGLAIAKRTIDAHGGQMIAVPAAETGLTFSIELPLAGHE